MTTVHQIKRTLAPLVERYKDLSPVGFTLYVRPVRHVLRGITIRRLFRWRPACLRVGLEKGRDMSGTTEGMVGGGYYDAHSSFQAKTAASGGALLSEAVAVLTLPADGQATVADYGCSEGGNSMAIVGEAR